MDKEVMTEGFYKTDTYKTSNDDTWTTPRAFFERYNNTFNFLWTQQRCSHPLWSPGTGMAPTTLTQRVEMRFVMTGLAIVTVGTCGLTHPTDARSKIGLLKQKLKARRDAQWYCWFPPELTLPGGTSIALRIKSNSLEVASSLGTSVIPLRSHRQL